MHLHAHVCHSTCVENREQLAEIGPLLPCEFQGSNSGHPSQWLVSLSRLISPGSAGYLEAGSLDVPQAGL